MKLFFVSFFIVFGSAHAEGIAQVQRILGQGASVSINGQTQILQEQMELAEASVIETNDSVVQLLIFPAIQMTIAKHGRLKLVRGQDEQVESQKVESVVELLQGQVRALVEKLNEESIEHTVKSAGAAFVIRGTEYEVEAMTDESDLQVYSGQVDVIDDTGKVQERVRKGERRRWRKGKLARLEFRQKRRELEFKNKEELKERRRLRRQNRQGKRSERKERKQRRR